MCKKGYILSLFLSLEVHTFRTLLHLRDTFSAILGLFPQKTNEEECQKFNDADDAGSRKET
jgi:hypothetical protein